LISSALVTAVGIYTPQFTYLLYSNTPEGACQAQLSRRRSTSPTVLNSLSMLLTRNPQSHCFRHLLTVDIYLFAQCYCIRCRDWRPSLGGRGQNLLSLIVSLCECRRRQVAGISGAPSATYSTPTTCSSAQHPCFSSNSPSSQHLHNSHITASLHHSISASSVSLVSQFLIPASFSASLLDGQHPCFICAASVSTVTSPSPTRSTTTAR